MGQMRACPKTFPQKIANIEAHKQIQWCLKIGFKFYLSK